MNWYSSHTGKDRCPNCRRADELFARDGEFWAGRRRRQEYLEAGKIMTCYYRHLKTRRTVRGWFWTSRELYKTDTYNQSGIVNLPNAATSILTWENGDDILTTNPEHVC